MKRYVVDYRTIGYGDIIQDMQVLLSVRSQCDQIVAIVPEILRGLLQFSLSNWIKFRTPEELIPMETNTAGEPWFKTIMEMRQSFKPAGSSYLKTPPGREFDLPHGQNIGIAWTAKYKDMDGSRRSTSAGTVINGLAPTGATLHCLQPDRRDEVLGYDVRYYPFTDFADCARLMTKLDCVVSVDTAACHLAGALGVPCYTLLQADPSYRSLDFPKYYQSLWNVRVPVYRMVTGTQQDPHALAYAVQDVVKLLANNQMPPRQT